MLKHEHILKWRCFREIFYYDSQVKLSQNLGEHKGGEGNGTPLQYSCLENPVDGGAWWAAVYGVSQSRTRLK